MRLPVDHRILAAALVTWLAVSPLTANDARSGNETASTSQPQRAATQDREVRGNWNHWRGGPRQQGTTEARLPEKLKIRWQATVPEGFSGSAVIAHGKVFAGAEDGTLYAFDQETGSTAWKYEKPDMIQASASVCRDLVLIGDDLGTMHAVAATDGKKQWTFQTDGQIVSAVSCAHDLLVFGSYDGFVYALHPEGKLAWKFETAGRVHGTPAISGDTVVAAGCDEYLHMLNVKDGSPRARIPMAAVSGASATVIGNRAFVGTYGNQVLGIDIQERRVVWRFEDQERQFPFMSSCAVREGLVVVGGRDKRIRALNSSNGRPAWTHRAMGRVDSSPVIAGDRVFIGAGDGVLYELDLKSGKEKWRFETGSAIAASPAITDGLLVIGTLDGILYAFGEKKTDAEKSDTSGTKKPGAGK